MMNGETNLQKGDLRLVDLAVVRALGPAFA